MKRFFCPVCVGAFSSALLLGLPVMARAQALGTHYFVRSAPLALRGALRAGGKGFLIEAPLVVADSGVREVMATPNGARLIVLRQTYRPSAEALLTSGSNTLFGPHIMPGEASVTVWNTFTQKGTVVWRQRIAPGETFYFQTTGILHGPSGDRALVAVTVEKPNEKKQGDEYAPVIGSILLVDTDKSVARQVSVSPQDYGMTDAPLLGLPNPSPVLPFAAMTPALTARFGSTANSLRFLRSDGSLTNPISLPGNISWKGWKNNGTVLRGVQTIHAPHIDKKPTVSQWFDADPRTNTLIPIEAPLKTNPVYEEMPAPDTLPELELAERPALPQSGMFAPSVWLQAKRAPNADPKTKPDSVLLFAEGQPVFLLPRAAVFLSNGALYAAGIQTISEATLAQIERKAKRERTLSDTKQIGLAFMMYLQDNDIKFPATAGNLSGNIGGYLKNPSMLDGFVYTPPNPLGQAQMENVASVVLGYLPGDGGKAVLYADGHVKWQDTP